MRTTKMTPVVVECYSGYKGDQSPRRLRRGGTWIEIEEICDCWQQAGSGGERSEWFRVRDTGGTAYLLKHDLGAGTWYLGTR